MLICLVVSAVLHLEAGIGVVITVIITAVWAGINASRIELKRYKTKLLDGKRVFLIVLLLWIIGFPWYLSVKEKIKQGLLELRDEYKRICKNCGSVGFPKNKCRGRLGIELTFWIFPIVILLCTFANYNAEYNMTFDQFSSYISNPFEDAMRTLVLSGDPSGFGDLESLRELMSNMPPDKVLKLIAGQEDTIILLNITFLLFWGIGLIYSLWRWMSRRPVCYSCGVGKDSLIPLNTPLGANLLNQYNHELPSDKKIDVLSQIEKLAELKEKGVLSEEEFQAQKAKLLSS